MVAMPWRSTPDPTGTTLLDRPADELLLDALGATEQRADCCSARPLHRVILATSDPTTGELLLCGHHYRRHSEALVKSGAAVS
ncbi:MAG TPA: hypothetical protein VE442_08825 [Jatrophihabitans sp.]|jgi:hypothetical protein|nr:hypothetical protein [Jatrophihabitans sp.]